METQEQLAARHIALRERAGLTQEQEAKAAGVSPTTISGIESGKITRPHLKTLLKLARALGADVGELRESGKVEAPPSPEQPPLNGFDEERRAEWDAAVRHARQLREHGRTRMDELLATWRASKERGEAPDARRRLRSTMGDLLQEVYDAQTALMANLEAGLSAGDREAANLLAAGAKEVPNPGWTEVQEAEGFYLSLINAVLEAGLSVRRGYKAHEVQDAA